jgi:glycosyltransferase involved in cell wall biosynthesis
VRILVYDDTTDFGGHQIMVRRGVEALAGTLGVEVIAMINPLNLRLAQALSEIGGIQILSIPLTRSQLQALKPDIVLCAQGDIQQSVKGIRAAKSAGIECVSYLALPHSLRQMGAKLGGLRDQFNRHLLNLPDRFITISEKMKGLLIERGVRHPVSVVPNGIPVPPKSNRPLPPLSPAVIGMFSRIEFSQKRQDFMLRAFCRHAEAFKGCTLLIAGSGPDETRLRKRVSGNKRIQLIPWQKDIETFFEQIDILVIPSRYEGVPLVMLEALARGIPVIGSACDGMADLLPASWTFENGNTTALADTFLNLRKNGISSIDDLRLRVLSDYTLDSFSANFRHALLQS